MNVPDVRKHRPLVAWLVTVALLTLSAAPDARADASEASAMSLLPIGVLSEAPAALLASSGQLVVVAVQAVGDGTTWVLQRASDGARASLTMSGRASMPVGTSLLVTAVTTGWVLSAAGKAVAWTPNELGASLLHSERVSP